VESGRDITQGGAIYNHSSVNLQGLATVANSLAAIRWAVFEEKLLTLEELVGHLRNNFEGAEDLRQRLGRKAPKYGNDNPEADDIATWVTDLLCRNVRQHEHALGGTYRASIISAGSQTREGRSRAASADGRPAGAAVSNGISPANGTELTGATAALCSVAKACASPVSNGSACNMNLNPATIKSDEGVEKLASLVEGYFRLGGRHVQFNPMGLDVLKDAQAHPEKYPDLMVKVSGYSTLFVDISKPLQDDIIARTEFADV
jgi:formate C-acetyltransferase